MLALVFAELLNLPNLELGVMCSGWLGLTMTYKVGGGGCWSEGQWYDKIGRGGLQGSDFSSFQKYMISIVGQMILFG